MMLVMGMMRICNVTSSVVNIIAVSLNYLML